MATKIDIASNALLLIGDVPISAFTEPGAGAQVAANIYEDTYASVLASHPWSFAFKEQRLSRLTQVPDQETNYSYAHQVPVDLIRLWAILPHSDYVIVGGLLYSNQPDLLARYIYRVMEQDLPAQVIKAVEYKLAADFAIAITEDEKKNALYEQKFLRQLAMARSIDSQGRPQESVIDSPFVDVRGTGGRW
jgi:hypothetical protein